MRPGLVIAAAFFILVSSAARAEPERTTFELESGIPDSGLALAESQKDVYGFRFTGHLDKNNQGSGVLELDLNAPAFDEFGFRKIANTQPVLKLDCRLKFVKKAKFELPTE